MCLRAHKHSTYMRVCVVCFFGWCVWCLGGAYMRDFRGIMCVVTPCGRGGAVCLRVEGRSAELKCLKWALRYLRGYVVLSSCLKIHVPNRFSLRDFGRQTPPADMGGLQSDWVTKLPTSSPPHSAPSQTDPYQTEQVSLNCAGEVGGSASPRDAEVAAERQR